ncbi:MAG: DUF4292 domain-containing protein [Bacteroidota bacterium]
MNYTKLLILLCVLALSGAACKSKQDLTTTKVEKISGAERAKRQMIQHQLKADWLVGRAKVSLAEGSFAQSGMAELRMRKDSAIWMSVRKFGIEGARALITKDSVFLIDRLNRRYAAEDLSFLAKQYNLPASFGTLQAMLLGNPIFLGRNELELMSSDSTNLMLQTEQDGRTSTYEVQAADYRLKKMQFEETASKQSLSNVYQDYRSLADGQKFSYFRQIDVNTPNTGTLGIRMEFSKVEVNVPTTIRFEIPKQYTKMQ